MSRMGGGGEEAGEADFLLSLTGGSIPESWDYDLAQGRSITYWATHVPFILGLVLLVFMEFLLLFSCMSWKLICKCFG